jgi:hypothetical protein
VRALILGCAASGVICVYQAPAMVLAQAQAPIIDMHLHADLPPYDIQAGTPDLCRPEPCQGTGRPTAGHADTLKKTLEAMDRYNVVKPSSVASIPPSSSSGWLPHLLGSSRHPSFCSPAPDPGRSDERMPRGALAAWGRLRASSLACRRTIRRSSRISPGGRA